MVYHWVLKKLLKKYNIRYKSVYIENNKDCVATIKNNRPSWNVLHKDVCLIKKYPKTDILLGGFPCQSFSHAGHRLGLEDTRGTLFYEFARAIKQSNPIIFMGENVEGLKTHNKGKTLLTILEVLSSLGYRVKYKVLDASMFDVPQKRKRLILIGVRKDIKLEYNFPKGNNKIHTLHKVFKDSDSYGYSYSICKKKIMALVPMGGNWKDLPNKQKIEYMGVSLKTSGGKTGMARRLDINKPSPTILCSPSQKTTERCHPIETRPISIQESARIQTFPDSWKFIGSKSSQYKQIGNAIPVNLAYYLGLSIIKFIKKVVDN